MTVTNNCGSHTTNVTPAQIEPLACGDINSTEKLAQADSGAEWLPPAEQENLAPEECLNPDSIRAAIESERARNAFGLVPIHLIQNLHEDIEWLWRGFLARECVTLLTAHPKVGKTTLISHVLKAFGTGGDIGGAIVPAKVAVITEESAKLWIRRAQTLGLGEYVHIASRPFKGRPSSLVWKASINALAAQVKNGDYDVVIIDTFASMSPISDENQSAEVLAALTPLQKITEAGAALLLIHHTRKSSGREGTSSRGSSALTGFADIMMELARYRPDDASDRRRKITSYSRCEETPHELVLELTDHGYEAVGSVANASCQDRSAVIEKLLSAQGDLTVEEILESWPKCEIVKPGKRAIENDLSAGVRSGRWMRAGKGAKGSPYRFSVAVDSILARTHSIGARNESEMAVAA